MGASVTATDASGRYSLGVPERGAMLEVQAPGFATLREPAPSTGSADLELVRFAGEGATSAFVLRMRFASQVTDKGEVRAVRLHVRRVGQDGVGRSSATPVKIDPRRPFELPIAQPSRVRITVSPLGSPKPLFREVLDLRGARSLSIQ